MTMNKIKTIRYIIYIVAALLLNACENENLSKNQSLDEIRLTAGVSDINADTRATSQQHLSANGQSFTVDQHIALFISERSGGSEVFNGIYQGDMHTLHTAANNVLEFDLGEKCYWPGTNNVNFYAWHPYIVNGAFTGKKSNQTTTFSVLADQSSLDAYTSSDLMSAISTNVAKTESAVPLTFSHKLSKVVIVLQSNTEGQITAEQLASATVSIQQANAATPFYLDSTVDIDAGTTTLLTTGNSTDEILLGTGSTTMCVLPPGQSLKDKKIVFDMGLDGGANDYTIKMEGNLLAGKVYTITLKLTLTHIEVTETVVDWQDDRTWDKSGQTLFI